MSWKDAVALLGALSCLSAENWPAFRGPSRQGISSESAVPTKWSASSGIAWKTPIPGEGWSSPIVWEDRVFVSTATEGGESCRLLSLDAATGKIRWDVELVRMSPGQKESKNSYASPTPATDGRNIFVTCGDGSAAAVGFDGKLAWLNRDYRHFSQHGLGSSPVLAGDLMIMARDGSSRGEDPKLGWQKPWNQSFVVALDKHSGKLRWIGKRGMSRIAHATPNLSREGSATVLVSGAGDVVQGFDLSNGALLWTVRSQGEGVVPSVVVGDGIVYTASGFEKPTIRAVRTGGRGEVSQTHIAWEQTRGVPMISSMLLAGETLFSITTNGVAYAYDAKTGEVLGQARIGGNHSASPVMAGGKLYFSSEEGDVVVTDATREMTIIATNSMGERMQASPAISRGRIFLRTAGYLYCVEGD